ncbi:M56 family metallopeptidase [Flexithrix dorotheae]|uniref:M56 family metallopeptidase n=1 Tax=Flexithrix dorotheae TaxID=70993 RepID=UPI0003A8FFA4|nr:M56 family metallopeptidase [Flexithrix dorotheae]
MHHFKRYYLLVSLLFSFLIPQFEIPSAFIPEVYPKQENLIYTEHVFESYENIPSTFDEPESENAFVWITLIYSCISGILVIRFLKNLIGPVSMAKHAEKHRLKGRTLILCNQEISPFCFLNWIFVNKSAFNKNKIEAKILTHEFAHADQKHSLDIILIELLLTLCWFNPILFFYRNAIRLNHEFLADEAVLKQHGDPHSYQQLILHHVAPNTNFVLSHSFNFLTLKRRLIMMTVKTSTFSRIIKQISVLPMLMAVILVFGEKTFAQLEEEWIKPAILKTHAPKQDIVGEVLAILSKYQESNPDWKKNLPKLISEKDEKQIEGLYLKMDKTQKDQLPIVFLDVFTEKKVPSSEQIESFKDEKMYGVWIDGVRVKNDELNNFTNSDFSHFGKSRLTKTAKHYGIYVYHLSLMTNTYWDKKMEDGTIGYRLLFVKK